MGAGLAVSAREEALPPCGGEGGWSVGLQRLAPSADGKGSRPLEENESRQATPYQSRQHRRVLSVRGCLYIVEAQNSREHMATGRRIRNACLPPKLARSRVPDSASDPPQPTYLILVGIASHCSGRNSPALFSFGHDQPSRTPNLCDSRRPRLSLKWMPSSVSK